MLPKDADDLLRRARKVLIDLYLSSEASGNGATDGTRRRKPESKRPPTSGSDFDQQLQSLELWLIKAEKHRDHKNWRPPARIPEYKDWAKFVVETYTGHAALSVAVAENCSVLLVRKVRRRAGRTEDRGQVRERPESLVDSASNPR